MNVTNGETSGNPMPQYISNILIDPLSQAQGNHVYGKLPKSYVSRLSSECAGVRRTRTADCLWFDIGCKQAVIGANAAKESNKKEASPRIEELASFAILPVRAC